MSIRHSALAFVLFAGLSAAANACGGDDAGEPEPVGAGTDGATATAVPDIRSEDLTQQPGVTEFLAAAGGTASLERAVYADLTGDGIDEVVLPISSGGEGGDIAAFVYGYTAGGLTELLRVLPEADALAASVVEGRLTIEEPIYAPGDPLCCPSQLRTRTYQWDATGLALENESVEQSEPKDGGGSAE